MKKRPIKYLVTLFLVAVLLVLGYQSLQNGKQRSKINYKDDLDEVAICVDGEELTLRDMAFYVAYQEGEVDKQARVYNPEDPHKYWITPINGQYIQQAAKEAMIQMAIHDEIFYKMALEEGVSLTQEEESSLENTMEDFWYDLLDREGNEALGVTEEEIRDTMVKIALAQKYQQLYAEIQGCSSEDFAYGTDRYLRLMEAHRVEIKEELWKRIQLGVITVNNGA